MKFKNVLIAVRDIERSKAFYREVFGEEVVEDYGINVVLGCGLSLQQDFDWLACVPKESVHYQSHAMELYFEAEDIEAAVAGFQARGDIRFVHPLKTYGWQQRVARIYDPDGHILEIGESMDAVVARLFAQGQTKEEIAAVTQQGMAFVERALAKSQVQKQQTPKA